MSGGRKRQPAARHLHAILDRCRVVAGEGFRLADHPTALPEPDHPGAHLDKKRAGRLLRAGVARLSALQAALYADATWSLLLVFQAMDAGGKDGTIKHVMSGVNPQGVAVTPFRVPGPEELAHDFLWRSARALPARGMIGVFNRSYYEDVLAVRVRPEALARQRLPPALAGGEEFWTRRLQDIAGFERHLAREGTRVLKFFLHISREEQRRRFLSRLDDPAKTWKFAAADLQDRAAWDRYQAAYEAAIAGTAAEQAPWFVVPADQKWLARLVVVEAINEALGGLDLRLPQPSPEQAGQLAQAHRRLEAEE